MFTGIIETTGTVQELRSEGSNLHLRIKSDISGMLRVDQSVAHNGVCLTVTEITGDMHWVTAVDETLRRSNLGTLVNGSKVNLERCMPANGRYDGHMVQGHVDDTALCTEVKELDGSWLFYFRLSDPKQQELVVDKGSICINGVSLTVVNITDDMFYVTIIPYTFDHTNFGQLKAGDKVNIEFDILGKYIRKMLQRT